MLTGRHRRLQAELAKWREADAALESRRPIETTESNESGEMAEYYREYERLWEWRQLILTRYWESKAVSYEVIMPDLNDKALWGQVEYDDDSQEPRYLTDAGIARIKAAIREEQKHRREVAGFWVTLVVGCIGALTGLASVLVGS